jgi:acetylornithine deacetylase/succinyl-diaminopimelate desuccinylase-like protein
MTHAWSTLAVALAILIPQSPALAADATPPRELRRFHEIFKELVETNTTNSSGSCTVAAEAMAKRLKQAGYADGDMQVIVPPDAPTKGNLVLRLKGSGEKRPLLLVAHLDVVEAKREDWVRDPFKLIEENGVYYGRGTSDDKSQVATHVSNMLRYKEEKLVPKRDIIMALTCDEEIIPSKWDGLEYLLKHHRALIDAELALNEGGGGTLDKNEQPVSYSLQIGEKVYVGYEFEVTNPGGHSAVPVRDNAIYRLSEGLARLSKFDFPIQFNDTTRAYFERVAQLDGNKDIAADLRGLLAKPTDTAALERLWTRSPVYNSSVRTTCVATMVEAGHATNALPQRARATVNCRILPGQPAEDVRRTLVKVMADERITVRAINEALASPQPPMSPFVIQAVENTAAEFWPGVPVIPTMLVATTDGRFLNNAGIWTYGVGTFSGVEPSGVHGLNEHIRVKSLNDFHEFMYRLGKRLAL